VLRLNANQQASTVFDLPILRDDILSAMFIVSYGTINLVKILSLNL